MSENESIRFEDGIPESHAYFSLFESTSWNELYDANTRELYKSISNSWYTLCVYNDENELVGFGRIVSDGVLYAFVCDIIVASAHQNQGIGSNILKKLVTKCKVEGIRVVWLFAASNKSSFYKKHGFDERPSDAPGMQLNLHNTC